MNVHAQLFVIKFAATDINWQAKKISMAKAWAWCSFCFPINHLEDKTIQCMGLWRSFVCTLCDNEWVN